MKRNELKISKGMPIPPKARGWRPRSPITIALLKMVTGDSVDIPLEGTNKNSLQISIRAKAKATKSKVVIRHLTIDGKEILRVWKLKQLP